MTDKMRLIIEDLHGEQRWERELADDESLDLVPLIESWIETNSDGCLRLASWGPMPGAYLATVTDDPREFSCWDVTYFDTEAVPE